MDIETYNDFQAHPDDRLNLGEPHRLALRPVAHKRFQASCLGQCILQMLPWGAAIPSRGGWSHPYLTTANQSMTGRLLSTPMAPGNGTLITPLDHHARTSPSAL